jgi:hypothetical protein
MPTSDFQPLSMRNWFSRAMSAGVTMSATQLGNGSGGCCPAGTHRVSRSSWLPAIRRLLRPRVRNRATALPLLASKLPVQPPLVQLADSSRISNDSPTKSEGSVPKGCARSTTIAVLAVVSAWAVPVQA